jgi:hypothetical protein
MDPATLTLVLKALDIVASGLALAPELKARYDFYRAKIDQMIAEGRPPTEAEFGELLAEGDDLSKAIAAAAARKG